jgi:hypothetical protein
MTGTVLGDYTYSMRIALPTLPGISSQVCEIHGFAERAAVGGDMQEFQTLYQENLGLIYRYVYNKVGNRRGRGLDVAHLSQSPTWPRPQA